MSVDLLLWVEVAREQHPTATEAELLNIAQDYERCFNGTAE